MSTHLPTVKNLLKKANRVAVPINPSNLWRLGNTNFLHRIQQEGRGRQYQFVVGDTVRITRGPEKNSHGKVAAELDVAGQPVATTISRAIPAGCVQLVHPDTLDPVKTEYRGLDTGFGYVKFKRFIAGTETVLPHPVTRGSPTNGPKDTTPEDAQRVTYKPDMNRHPLPYGCLL